MEKIDLNQSIYEFEFGRFCSRIRHALWHAGIHTIGDLCLLNSYEVERIRNIGSLSMEDINDSLRPVGLRIGMSVNELEWYKQEVEPANAKISYDVSMSVWEERKFELAKEIYLRQETPRTTISAEVAIAEAGILIEVFQESIKKNQNNP